MKFRIKPYALALIRENVVYICADLLLAGLTGIIIWSSIVKNVQNTEKITSLTTEVKSIRNKSALLNSALTDAVDFDADLKMLNSLIPDAEDFFSILYALEKLSQNTGFLVTSYTINMGQTTANKFRISIEGAGDSTSFMKFLKDYNYGGGRLITSDKIELSSQLGGNIKINLTFYNKKAVNGSDTLPSFDKRIWTELAAIKEKVQLALKTGSEEGELDFSYPRSTSPF